jgi:hypothetical protein
MKTRNNPMTYETFDLRFEGCGRTLPPRAVDLIAVSAFR